MGGPARRITALLAGLGLAVALSSPARAAELAGTGHVVDGHRLVVDGVRLRLWGVVAPELDTHRLAWAAHEEMGALLAQGPVVCAIIGDDAYGQTLARCHLTDGRDLGAALVAAGLARDCPAQSNGRYAPFETNTATTLPLPHYCEPDQR